MILINRLVTGTFGWRVNFMDRLERAAKELGREDVIFFPEPMKFSDRLPGETEDVPDRPIGQQEILSQFEHRIKLSMLQTQRTISYLMQMHTKETRTIQKIVFLEAYQFPHVVFSLLGWCPLYETFIHANADLPKYPHYGAKAIIEYSKALPRIVVQTPSTGASYKTVPYRVVGGFLELYRSPKPKRHAVMWSSNRVYDEAKGWKEFLEIVGANPDIPFIACVERAFHEAFRYRNLECYESLTSAEYIQKCASVKYILSTSKTDSFSYGLYDAISVGCIPLVTDQEFHTDWIPRKFIYKDKLDFTLEATDEELSAIVDHHYYHRSFERLIAMP